jgi:hypothetical protein
VSLLRIALMFRLRSSGDLISAMDSDLNKYFFENKLSEHVVNLLRYWWGLDAPDRNGSNPPGAAAGSCLQRYAL